MKRLTAPWTTVLATAALLSLPIAGSAQTPQTPPEPQPEQSTTLSKPSAQDQTQTTQNDPAEHLRQAKAALANVDANNVPARAKSQLAALRRHINSLERSAGMNDSASATGADARSSKTAAKSRGGAVWANDVAAIDRIISELAGNGSASMTGSGDPGTAGTSGSATGSSTKGNASAAVTLDETSRSQLLEVRSHITAFAAAMSGTSSSSPSAASTSSSGHTGMTAGTAHSTSAHGSAATGHAGAATTTGTTSGQTGSATGETAQTGQAGSTAGQSSTPAAEPTGTAGEQPEQANPEAQGTIDPEAAKQHLTAARDSLTQLTQLPAAAQLQGEARTQVSQLIQNFNELITTQENWRDVYDKVEANLTALIGPDQQVDGAAPTTTPQAGTPEAAPANPPSDPPASAQGTQGTQGTTGTQGTQQGTEGAVGTSGTATAAATLDPGIRQKLVDFRNHLKAFHAAAGGGEAK